MTPIRRNRAAWDRLLARPRVVATCYCGPSADGVLRCHRVLWARDIMTKLGADYRGEWSEAPASEATAITVHRPAPDVIARVISGGQDGVDFAAIHTALTLHIPTGGMMPNGFRTQSGKRPAYARRYGMAEHASPAYPPRTYKNVADADITVRIAVDFSSAGEQCTLAAIERAGKPYADIPVTRGDGGGLVASEQDIWDAAHAIVELSRRLGRAVVLNIAGNSERTAPGIDMFARRIATMLIEAVDAEAADTRGDGGLP